MHVTPATTFVCVVTMIVSTAFLPSFVPLYVSLVPGTSGNHGLSTVLVNVAGSIGHEGSGPRDAAAVDCGPRLWPGGADGAMTEAAGLGVSASRVGPTTDGPHPM